MTTELDVFISSKMDELKPERDLLWDLIPTLLNGLVKLCPQIYEKNAPASSNSARELFLDILKRSSLYIGIFWNKYGEWTIDEFNHATEWGIDRLIFIKDVDEEERDTRLSDFLDRNNDVLTSPAYKQFSTVEDLQQSVRQAIEDWLVSRLSREPERQKRLSHLESFNEPIYRHLREYGAYLIDHPTQATKDEKRHRQIITDAIITCKAIGDRIDPECKRCLKIEAEQEGYIECSHIYEDNLAYIAAKRLTPSCVIGNEGPRESAEAQRWGWYGNRNRDALSAAEIRLKELIAALER